MIRVSTFLNKWDSIPKPVDLTWDQFVASLGPHRFDFGLDAKERGILPLFSPGEFVPGSRDKEKESIIRVHFGVLDVDHVSSEQLLGVCQKVEGYNAALYTTWSHSDNLQKHGLWSARICIEFSRPLDPKEWQIFWPRFAAHFGMVADPKCKDPNRCYYGAFAPPGTEPDANFIVFHGRPFDVDSLKGTSAPPPIQGTQKIPRDRLERLATRWKRSRDEWRSTMGEALSRLCKGEPFAEPGNIDNTIFQLCQDLAEAFPHAEPKSIAEHFVQSLQLMNFKGEYSLDRVTEKLERALASRAAEEADAQEAELTESKLRIRQAFAHIDPTRDWPYTEPELEAIRTKLGCTSEEMSKRWIIQRGNLFYVLSPGGGYSRPYTDKDVSNAVLRDLAPARTAGVELWAKSADGVNFRKPISTLMSECGSVAVHYVLDLRAQEAFYEPSQRVFTEAPCPLRKLEPAYDHDVARWLEILCGKQTPDVLNWIALATSLDETCAALLFTGAKDTGKSLFANGMSRLWTTQGAVPLASALGDFNDAVARCPLVFADEQLPKDWRGNGRTSELREFIAARSRPFKKKHYPESVILGAIRLVIAANNDEILAIQENLSVNDIEAIGDRFYHVEVNPDAATFLRACEPQTFVYDDRIAKHALWLRDNHPVKRSGRFLIQSTDRSFYRALSTQSGIRSAVCQWLVGYLKEPRKVDSGRDYKVRISKGRLFVTAKGLLDYWSLYVPNEQVPTFGRLSRAIKGLSLNTRHHLAVPNSSSMNYREIDLETVIAWAMQTEYATRDEIDRTLARDTENSLTSTLGRPSVA
jgi:hypothetical protein